jgi:hypothetical protein
MRDRVLSDRSVSLRCSRLRRTCLTTLVVVAGVSSAACGSSSSSSTPVNPGRPTEVLSNLKEVPVPEGGMAVYTPVIKQIQPGADITYCTYTDKITTEPLFVHTTLGSQSSFGHHVILFYSTAPEKPRTEECFGQDMAKFRQLLGGSGGEGFSFWTPPKNVGTAIPVGSQMVIQTHWINTGTEPVDVQGMMVTEPGDTGPDRIEAGSLAIVDTTFQIPAQQHYEETTECVFDREKHLMISLGHEHEWGTHVHAELVHAAGGTDVLFDKPYAPDNVFNPPNVPYGIENPLVIGVGDKVRMTCTWENTRTQPLTFPLEMCVFFGYTLDPDDSHCVDGTWETTASSADAGAPSGPPCVTEGTKGNEKGVGEFCSKGGGQCADNGSGNAVICAEDFGGPGYCTIPCVDASSCGSGSVCTGDSPTSKTKGCVPVACAPAWALDGGAPMSADAGTP